jgi:hypothetical protein
MKCENCREMNVEGAEICSNCGAVAGSPRPDTPEQVIVPESPKVPSRRRRPLRVGIMAVLLLVALTGVVKGYQYWFGMPVLESVIPDGSVGYACGDAHWLWDNTADVRAEPKVAAGLRQFESQMGFDLEKDVVPWAGNVAVAMLDVRGANPMVAIYVQVKDQRQFYGTVQRVRAQSERRSGLQWSEERYNGVPVRKARYFTGTGPSFDVSTFWLKGWLVIGIGNETSERVIDTWQKRTPSIAMNAHWAKALSVVSPDAVAWFGYDGAAMQKVSSGNGLPMPVFRTSETLGVGSITPKPDGFRMESISVPTSPECTKIYTDLATKLKPISPDLLARLPDGAFVTAVVSSPAVWADLYKKVLTDSVMDPSQKKAINEGLKQIAPLEAAVHRVTGDAAGAVAWRQGRGFGGVVLADMGNEATAAQTANEITRFAKSHSGKVSSSANGSRFMLNVPDSHAPQLRLAPTWMASGKYFAFATHPTWLEPATTASRPTLPVEARGATMLAQGDFRPLEPFVADASSAAKPEDRATATGLAADTRLSTAHWASWSTVEPDGTVRGVGEISGWQWREATKALVKRVHDGIAKQNH